jgi:hypothetical protein
LEWEAVIDKFVRFVKNRDIMVIVLNKNSTKADIAETYKKLAEQPYKPLKGFNTKKYTGKL